MVGCRIGKLLLYLLFGSLGYSPTALAWQGAVPVISKPVREINAHPNFLHRRDATAQEPAVTDILFSSSGALLGSCGLDRTAREWDPTTGQAQHYYAEIKQEAYCLAYSKDGRIFARGGNHNYDEPYTIDGIGPLRRTEGCVYLYDVERGAQKLGVLVTKRGAAISVDFSPDAEYIAIGTDQGTCELWATNGRPQVFDLARTEVLHHPSKKGKIRVMFSPNGKFLLTSGPSAIRLWDVSVAKMIKVLGGQECATFSPDGSRIAFYSDHRSQVVQIWNCEVQEVEMILQPDRDSLTELHRDVFRYGQGEITFSADGNTLFQGHSRYVSVWDLSCGKARAYIDADSCGKGVVAHVSVSSDAKLIATASEYSPRIKIWNVPEIHER